MTLREGSHQIAVVSSNRPLQRCVTRAIASTGATVSPVEMRRESIEKALVEPRAMYIIDADGTPDDVFWLLERLATEHRETIPLLVSSDLDSRFLVELVAHHGIDNLISKHGGLSAQELVDEHELIVTCHKLLTRDIFGIEKHLSTWGIQIHDHQIKGKDDKKEAMSALQHFLDRVDCHAPLKPLMTNVADELLMNAIYSAARDADGKSKYGEKDRSAAHQLEASEYVDFRYGCDGRFVALSVADPFGSLNRDIIVNYLSRTLTGEKANFEDKQGGAGLGLFTVFKSINQLVFNIQRGVRTEVIALFYVRSGVKAFRDSGHSLNIFLI